MSLLSSFSRRTLTTFTTTNFVSYTPDLTLWPQFFSTHEQRILLTAALHKLDLNENKRFRQRKKLYQINLRPALIDSETHQDLFLPDNYYDFQEGHYDGVIHYFREMHLPTWPETEIVGLTPLLKRLYSLCPTQNTQTHLLHLATHGAILPHIDNVAASGSWIMGVSLGSKRTLRMEGPSEVHKFDIPLVSGSVYLQRDAMRFHYKHSILASNPSGSCIARPAQRLSIMIRDHPPTSPLWKPEV